MELPQGIDRDTVASVADEHGTPTYVTSATTVRDRFDSLRDAFPGARIQYAAKANTNPRILALLRERGAALDTVSVGEVIAGESAGFGGDGMMYTSYAPSPEELREVVDRGVLVNVDSPGQMETVIDAGAERVGVRVNPGVGAGHSDEVVTGGKGARFGVTPDEAAALFERALGAGVEPVCLHAHIGSGFLEPEPLVRATERICEIVDDLPVTPEYVDIGGGLGIPYSDAEEPLDVEALGKMVRDAFDVDATLVVEPGRYLVAESTVLVTRVNTVGDGVIGVDAGFNTLLRPAMYDAYHAVTNLSRDAAPTGRYDIAGPICESGDYLGHGRRIAEPREGDLLVVHTAGAYGFAMASRYNSRPLPAEVIVDDGVDVIREREAVDEQFRNVKLD
ncbi:diaminopimelate decarboxylase [Haladaptatus sp. F3-133]|uniref:Diaminopimelate decarboxylase n=1 Tax=Halorutilus salinus TaxID=2487751 RepID=A0A9Q4C0N6_9EURY|nr:diaminopimelate decarboxylase [Halorutilus salinus]MCX2817755.1 diaminopimelate decarboxylase [Halorutilus salinus]